jgi:nicotinate-nucleotide adenylyltransferase
VTGLLGGTFDPPHNGHLALARAALDELGVERLVVLVVASPGHRVVVSDAETRLRLARAAFAGLPRTEVRRDDHARTVDSLRAEDFGDAVFLVGADELAGFAAWKEPDEVLERVRLAVAARPGYPPEALDPVLGGLRRPDRVQFLDVEPPAVSSTEVRERVASGRAIDDLVPPAVADLIRELGLYRRESGLH